MGEWGASGCFRLVLGTASGEKEGSPEPLSPRPPPSHLGSWDGSTRHLGLPNKYPATPFQMPGRTQGTPEPPPPPASRRLPS